MPTFYLTGCYSHQEGMENIPLQGTWPRLIVKGHKPQFQPLCQPTPPPDGIHGEWPPPALHRDLIRNAPNRLPCIRSHLSLGHRAFKHLPPGQGVLEALAHDSAVPEDKVFQIGKPAIADVLFKPLWPACCLLPSIHLRSRCRPRLARRTFRQISDFCPGSEIPVTRAVTTTQFTGWVQLSRALSWALCAMRK